MLEIVQAVIFFASWASFPLARRFWRSQNSDIDALINRTDGRNSEGRQAAKALEDALERGGTLIGLILMLLIWAADFWLLPRFISV